MEENKRRGFEEVFMQMLSSPKYVDYSFYSFLISKMQISINNQVPTAGVGFYNDNFQLVINPGFFNPLPAEQRMGILIHECLHVMWKHIFRKGTRDHSLFNIAADIALNQSIPRKMLPEGAMYPDTFKLPDGTPYPTNKTAEQYYELLKDEKERQEQEKKEQEENGDGESDCDNCGGSGETEDGDGNKEKCESCNGSGTQPGTEYQPSNGNPSLLGQEPGFDSHELWDESSDEAKELADSMMEKMVEEATEKSMGNVPQAAREFLELWKRVPKISWKKELKRFVSSKRGSKEPTIKRRNRRQPNRMDLKGKKTAFDKPGIIVGLDVSGSMSNEEIINGLVEINEVCKLTNSTLNIVQIDTNIQGVDEYDPKQKSFKRDGCGGTWMGEMAKYLIDNKIKYDALVMISDLYIEDVSTDEQWKRVKKPTLWLNTSGTEVPWDGLRGHKIMDISKA